MTVQGGSRVHRVFLRRGIIHPQTQFRWSGWTCNQCSANLVLPTLPTHAMICRLARGYHHQRSRSYLSDQVFPHPDSNGSRNKRVYAGGSRSNRITMRQWKLLTIREPTISTKYIVIARLGHRRAYSDDTNPITMSLRNSNKYGESSMAQTNSL